MIVIIVLQNLRIVAECSDGRGQGRSLKFPVRCRVTSALEAFEVVSVKVRLAELTHDYLRAIGVQPEHNLLATVPDGGHVDVRVAGRADTWGAAVKAVMRPKYVSFLVHHMRLSEATCGE